MKPVFFLPMLVLLCPALHAQRVLVLTDAKTNRTLEVRQGDKVLLAFKTTQREVDNQPADVFVLRPGELKDSAFVHFKTRIRAITDSTLVCKNGREVRLARLAGLRRLSVGRQVVRTLGQGVGLGAFGTGVAFVSEYIGGGSDVPLGFFPSLGLGVGGGLLLQLVTDQVPARHLVGDACRCASPEMRRNKPVPQRSPAIVQAI